MQREFQSTRPRGARPTAPRVALVQVKVSIHAPARGATTATGSRTAIAKRFNPRAREGRDFRHDRREPGAYRFQSTRPRGARPGAGGADAGAGNRFNPRAREGRDPRRKG